KERGKCNEAAPSGDRVQRAAQRPCEEKECDGLRSQVARCTRNRDKPLRTNFSSVTASDQAMPITTLFRLGPVLFLASTLFSQTAAPVNPCTLPEQKQFDFWVGEWDATWPGQNAGETGHGTNSIKRVLDNCIVQENFSSAESDHLRGTSVSVFEPKSGHWKQTWVDNQGSYLDFVGDFKDKKLFLKRNLGRPEGGHVLNGMV